MPTDRTTRQTSRPLRLSCLTAQHPTGVERRRCRQVQRWEVLGFRLQVVVAAAVAVAAAEAAAEAVVVAVVVVGRLEVGHPARQLESVRELPSAGVLLPRSRDLGPPVLDLAGLVVPGRRQQPLEGLPEALMLEEASQTRCEFG